MPFFIIFEVPKSFGVETQEPEFFEKVDSFGLGSEFTSVGFSRVKNIGQGEVPKITEQPHISIIFLTCHISWLPESKNRTEFEAKMQAVEFRVHCFHAYNLIIEIDAILISKEK